MWTQRNWTQINVNSAAYCLMLSSSLVGYIKYNNTIRLLINQIKQYLKI